jgi:hypothetical protein
MFIKTSAVLLAAGLSWVSALNVVGHGGIHRFHQEEDVKTFDADNDDEPGWVLATEGLQSCDDICDDEGGVCNIIPMLKVNSKDILEYIVEDYLGLEAPDDYTEGSSNSNPSSNVFFALNYFTYNPSDVDAEDWSTCGAESAGISNRLCCCSKLPFKCPLSAGYN